MSSLLRIVSGRWCAACKVFVQQQQQQQQQQQPLSPPPAIAVGRWHAYIYIPYGNGGDSDVIAAAAVCAA
jgi:hypothetical protein